MDNKSPLSNIGWLDIIKLKNESQLANLYPRIIPNWLVNILIMLAIALPIYIVISNQAGRREYDIQRAEQIERARYSESITPSPVTSEWYTDTNGNTYLINR